MHYFDWHHTDADSFDKIVPMEFQAECGFACGDELRAGGHAGTDRRFEDRIYAFLRFSKQRNDIASAAAAVELFFHLARA